jgi:hypothetical protein
MIKHKRRDQFVKISDEAVEVFVRHEKLAPIYSACLRGGGCRSANPEAGQHCPECAAYIAMNNKLDELLGGEVWQSSPVVATTPEPPDWMTNEDMRTGWQESWMLRCELERLARARGLMT